eukprot:185647-Pyramimonas_sp.AAC.1
MACVLQFIDAFPVNRRLCTYGFEKDQRVTHVTAPLSHLTRHASVWGKAESMHVGVSDSHKAFDNVTLRAIIKAMLHL